MDRKSCGKLRCVSGDAQFFFAHKFMALGKVEGSIFSPFFETFELFSKTTLPNLRFCFQWVELDVRIFPAQTVTPNFFTQII